MREKKKEGVLKKVSAISLLAVIMAMVIVLGLSAVNVAAMVTTVNVSPNKVTLNITETQQFTATAFDQKDTQILDDVKFSWNVSNSTVGKVNETGFFTAYCPGTTLVNVIANNVTGTATINVEKGKEKEAGFAIPSGVIPWIIVGIIVFVSLLIFFGIVERTEDELILYTSIIWIAFAIIIPIVLFFVLHSLKIEIFEFKPIHMIIAIIAAILLPISVSLVNETIKEGKKERVEPSREKSNFLSAPSYSTINFKVFDEKNKQPISDAKVSVMKSDSLTAGYKGLTDQSGICEHDFKPGTYKCEIGPIGGYKPKSITFSVSERSGTIPIPLSKRTGNLTVQVKDQETGNPIQGVVVRADGVDIRTNEQGKAFFPGITMGAKEIKVDEIEGVYSGGTKTCEIREDATSGVSVSIRSLLRIPIDKESKLNALRNQLQDNYRRVSTYDPCIPSYYKSIIDNLVNLVKGMAGKPMFFVGSKNNPGETIGHLIDAVDIASREIIGVMTSKRNVDVYSAAMRLEKTEVGATPVDFDDSRVTSYIQDVENFYNSYYHTAQGKLFEIDTDITRKTGEMNVLPVSGLWRVARMLLNETSASSAETDGVKKGAMTLVADILLDYVDDMLKDAKIIERLKIMVI